MNILTGVVATALALSTTAAFAQTQVTAAQPYIGGYQPGPSSAYGGTASGQVTPAHPYIGGYQNAGSQPYIGGYGATAPAPVATNQSASTK